MLKHDFRADVGYWVHMTAHRFERAMNEELTGEGMTYRQGQVLAWLALDGDLAQCELADRMNVEPPSLVKVLDRMERDGLIARDACPGDRRRKVIRPTDQAGPIWDRILSRANRVRERAVQGLSPAQEEILLGLLQQVHDNLGPESDRSGEGCEAPGGVRPRPAGEQRNRGR